MNDPKKCCCLAVCLIIALRLSIGWQFLYEGLWKFRTLGTPTPWSAEGYLKNAQGPFRNLFRNMTGDPDDLSWLEYDEVQKEWAVEKKWNDWADRFEKFYDLDDSQKKRLTARLDGVTDFRADLAALPKGVSIPKELSRIVKFDGTAKRLICDGKQRMLAREREALLALAKLDKDSSDEWQKSVKAYHDAVQNLFKRATDPNSMSAKERLKATMFGSNAATDPSVSERTFALFGDPPRDAKVYRQKLTEYEADLAKSKKQAAMLFPREHLQKKWNEIQQLRGKLVGPVKAIESDLKTDANKILEPDQLARGPLRLPTTKVDRINKQTMWSLTILGILLLIGCCTRVAAVGGAMMLTMFYLPMPPWPGVPEAPGPEHSFIVNKNFIEIVALLAIAALPTGQWFGLDRLCSRVWCCRKKSKYVGEQCPAPTSPSR